MKYLYTTEPDEGCHEIKGVYGRPVHTSEQSKLKARGWKENPYDLRKDEEEGREEAEEEVSDGNMIVELYEQTFGKKPHHKMKPDTMKAKINEALGDD